MAREKLPQTIEGKMKDKRYEIATYLEENFLGTLFTFHGVGEMYPLHWTGGPSAQDVALCGAFPPRTKACKPFPPSRDLMKRRKGFIDVGKRLNLSKVEKVRLKHNFIEPILSYLFCTLKRILLTNNRSLKFDTFPGMLRLTPVKFDAVLKP